MFGLIVDYPGGESQENMLVFKFPHHVGTAAKDDLLTQLSSLISSILIKLVYIHSLYKQILVYKTQCRYLQHIKGLCVVLYFYVADLVLDYYYGRFSLWFCTSPS